MQPEIFLRKDVLEEYAENAIQASISDLTDHLENSPGVFWNAYSQKYGVHIRDYPYEARNGFFIDTERRVCTHRFLSKGIVRRETILKEEIYQQLVPKIYRPTWFDLKDAVRSYVVLITEIEELPKEIPVEEFGLFNSWGKVSSRDQFHHPRLIKPSWKMIKENYSIETKL